MNQTMKEELKVFPISVLNPGSPNKTLNSLSTEENVSVERYEILSVLRE